MDFRSHAYTSNESTEGQREGSGEKRREGEGGALLLRKGDLGGRGRGKERGSEDEEGDPNGWLTPPMFGHFDNFIVKFLWRHPSGGKGGQVQTWLS